MTIRRVVPDIPSAAFDRSRDFYRDFLGFEVGMDLGWVMTFVSPSNPTAQVTVMGDEATAPVRPDLTAEVADVDHLYAEARDRGYEIVHPLTDEPWGVRRFFVRDPDGTVVNVMMHTGPEG